MPGEATAVATPPAPAPAAPAAPTPPAAAITPPPAPAAVATPTPAPAEVKLALPKEGAAIDQARVDELTAFAKANGLSQAAADKLLERENAGAAGLKAANEAANVQALAAAKQAWISQTAAAEDLAGKDGKGLVASKEIATKALTKFGDADLNALMADTGFGEHPVVLRFLKRIGAALGEDGLPAGGANLGTKQPKNLADFYKPAT